jgi:hypothetical protein
MIQQVKFFYLGKVLFPWVKYLSVCCLTLIGEGLIVNFCTVGSGCLASPTPIKKIPTCFSNVPQEIPFEKY